MKKFIYILILAATTSMVAVSCTEENIEPTQQNGTNTGGSQNDPIKG